MQKEKDNRKIWVVSGWAAAVLSQLIYWCLFIFRHDYIVMPSSTRIHPAYDYAQIDAMLAQTSSPYDMLFAGFVDMAVPFLYFLMLFVIYEVHLSPKAPHSASLVVRLAIVAAGLAFLQLLMWLDYRAEYYRIFMIAGKVLVTSVVWFAFCAAEKLQQIRNRKTEAA